MGPNCGRFVFFIGATRPDIVGAIRSYLNNFFDTEEPLLEKSMVCMHGSPLQPFDRNYIMTTDIATKPRILTSEEISRPKATPLLNRMLILFMVAMVLANTAGNMWG